MIVNLVDVAAQGNLKLSLIFEVLSMDLLCLEAIEERLHVSVVGTLAGTIHAQPDSVPL